MYVIFPAEEVVELTLGGIVVNHHHHHYHHHHHQHLPTTAFTPVNQQVPEHHHHHPPSRGNISQTRQSKHDKKRRKSVRSSKKQQQQQQPQQQKQQQSQQQQQQQQQEESEHKQQQDESKMASGGGGGGGEVTLRDITHPALNEALKAHNSVTFKLVRTVSDFTQQLSQIYEQHAEEMQLLVSNFRKRNGELRKERPACPSSLFHTWETLLQEVEIDSQAHSDIASVLGRQVSRPLLERSFHRKIQSRKVFTHRESYETILTKTEDKLSKCRQDYKNAYMAYLSNPSTATLAAYFDAHNAYVQQLHATNGMLDQYHHDSLPQLLQELEDVYSDLCTTLSDAVLQGAEIISARAVEQSRRYDGLSSQCRAVAGPTDLAHFVRSLPMPQTNPHHPSLRHNFLAPHPPPPPENLAPDGTPLEPVANDPTLNPPPPLKDEIVVDRLASVPVRSRYEALRKEASELDVQMKQLQDALDTLLRIQQRSLESSLYNKANELQEDISMKRFDLRVAQIHLGAVKAQKELFASKVESASDSNRERKMSSSSTGSMKNKWLKAFKSLKTTGASNGAAIKEAEKKNQMYHAVSTIMSMRKNGKDSAAPTLQTANLDPSAHQFQEYTYKKITPCDVCSQVLRGHTRQGLKCRICKLNVHVDCQEKVGRCQPKSRLLRRQKSTSEIETRVQEPVPDEEMNTVHFGPEKPDRPTRLRPIAPSSPVHNRRLLSARNMRMSSVELPDDNEKSLSSASTSPCPSPKPHRLLPTNLYVVLYNFKSRHPDELDLKAGYKVTVIDTSDQDWWKGKCLGRIGYFPSKYVIKLQPGERPLQVTHNLQVSDGDNGLMLLRDQIVIQVGEELDGMVMIRSGDNRQGVCPLKFLQEV